jgi:hypothetical protein
MSIVRSCSTNFSSLKFRISLDNKINNKLKKIFIKKKNNKLAKEKYIFMNKNCRSHLKFQITFGFFGF